MKQLALKLKDEIFEEVEKITHSAKIPRNAYINQALNFYNQLNRRKILKAKLRGESMRAREESLKVLGEFEKLEDQLPEW